MLSVSSRHRWVVFFNSCLQKWRNEFPLICAGASFRLLVTYFRVVSQKCCFILITTIQSYMKMTLSGLLERRGRLTNHIQTTLIIKIKIIIIIIKKSRHCFSHSLVPSHANLTTHLCTIVVDSVQNAVVLFLSLQWIFYLCHITNITW